MKGTPELIVMLTHNDYTVSNAVEVFESCKDAPISMWGFKEAGLARDDMLYLAGRITECGKIPVLEVVAYDEDECIRGAEVAAECGCGILMGTVYYDAVNSFCTEHDIKYLPFVGKVEGRPSVLSGEIYEIASEAKAILERGIYGIDLLGYRYTGNSAELNGNLIDQLPCPVCIAGGVDSYDKLDEIKAASPWAFTVGSAFFQNKFGDNFKNQIYTVLEYIKK